MELPIGVCNHVNEQRVAQSIDFLPDPGMPKKECQIHKLLSVIASRIATSDFFFPLHHLCRATEHFFHSRRVVLDAA